jgi:hypothetical protein
MVPGGKSSVKMMEKIEKRRVKEGDEGNRGQGIRSRCREENETNLPRGSLYNYLHGE